MKIRPGKPSKTPTINGVKSLTLRREVAVHMVTADDDNAKAIPPVAGAPAGNPFAPAAGGQPQPPVKITCQGPFYFDMDHKVATFNEKVDVFRLNANGPSDEMNCELLAVHFAEREKAGSSLRRQSARQAIRPAVPRRWKPIGSKPWATRSSFAPRHKEVRSAVNGWNTI